MSSGVEDIQLHVNAVLVDIIRKEMKKEQSSGRISPKTEKKRRKQSKSRRREVEKQTNAARAINFKDVTKHDGGGEDKVKPKPTAVIEIPRSKPLEKQPSSTPCLVKGPSEKQKIQSDPSLARNIYVNTSPAETQSSSDTYMNVPRKFTRDEPVQVLYTDMPCDLSEAVRNYITGHFNSEAGYASIYPMLMKLQTMFKPAWRLDKITSPNQKHSSAATGCTFNFKFNSSPTIYSVWRQTIDPETLGPSESDYMN
ncbi:unnamed protein product [Calicophoron daubneyi]|uniref:Uncharacterized protein n=1 Tax=Calicophoron daubneyi TaxID=300641 RepID=A0AAV2TGA7_CALDB